MKPTPDRPGPPNAFEEKRTYRRRRLMDAARVAPLLALALWMLPLIWPQTGESTVSSATALVYIFVVWSAVIVLTWALSRGLGDGDDTSPDQDT